MYVVYFFLNYLTNIIMKKALLLPIILVLPLAVFSQQDTCSFNEQEIEFRHYGPYIMCPGYDINFQGYYPYAKAYHWDFDNGDTSNLQSPRDILFNEVGTYYYTLTITNNCDIDTTLLDSLIVDDNLDFNPSDYLSFEINPKVICPGEFLRFSIYGNRIDSSALKIFDGMNTVEFAGKYIETDTFKNPGILPVELTLFNKCGNDTVLYDTFTVDASMTYFDMGVPNVELSKSTICTGEEVRFEVNGSHQSVNWDLGDGAGKIYDNRFYYEYSSIGTYDIEVSLTNFCGFDTILTEQLEVRDDVRFSGYISQSVWPGEICPGEKVQFSSNEEDAKSFEWNISGETTSNMAKFSRVFETPGDYAAVLTLTNYCGIDTTVIDSFSVKENIQFSDVNYSISPRTTCPNQRVRFEANTNAKRYTWTFGDGNVSSTRYLRHEFSGEKDKYPVTLTLLNGCNNSKSVTDTVYIDNSLPVGNYDFQALNENTCPEQEVFFSVDIEKAGDFIWNFGDGKSSTNALAVHKYNHEGNYNATFQVTNGCGRDTIISKTISVRDDIIPELNEYAYDDQIKEACIGDSVAFMFLPAPDGLDVSWDFGDGNSSSTPEIVEITLFGMTFKGLVFKHMYTANGEYKAALNVTNACGNFASDSVIVKIKDNAEINDLDFDLISGELALNEPLLFVSRSDGMTIWDFGDGTPIDTLIGTFQYVEHTYTQPGSYNISIASYNACGDFKSTQETIEFFDPELGVTRLKEDLCQDSAFNYNGLDINESGYYDFVYNPDSIIVLEVDVHPNWELETDTSFCQGEAIQIDGTWHSTAGTQAFASLISSFGCDSSVTYTLKYDTMAYQEEICLVTVDQETGKNLVTWEKTPGRKTTGYSVWRESNTQGVYDSIVYLPFDSLSVFVDIGSEPEQQQELYKLMSYDVCGNETNLNDIPYHKTLFLQYVGSIGGVNLSWKLYEIDGVSQTFNSYIIFRGTSPTNLAPIDTVSGSLNAYTDDRPDALSDLKYYRVAGVKAVECDPNGKLKANAGPFSRSLSNLEDNRQQGSNVSEQSLSDKISMSIYPNPYGDYTNIHYRLNQAGNVRIAVLDMAGRKLETIANDHQPEGEYKFRFSAKEMGYGPGMFLLNVEIDGQRMVKTLVEMK